MKTEDSSSGIDKTDRKLLKLLQADGRMSNADLAAKAGISATACWTRTKRLHEAGLISGTHARLNYAQLGYPVLVCVGVVLDRSTPELFKAFEQEVAKVAQITECLLLAGEFDYLLKMRVKDVDAFSRMHAKTLLRLPGVRQLRSFFVLNECKVDAPMPLD
ncbi:MAG: Lrp/AsnC family transcriptional regulator, partial [Pseudomonadota bacterium]